jgi:hypothetical protein
MNSFRIVLLLTGALFSLSPNAQATKTGGKTAFFGVGTTFLNVGKTTSTTDGATSAFGQLYIPLSLTLKFPIANRLSLQPTVSYTPLAVTAADSVSKKILTYGLNAAYVTSPVIEVKGGLGILSYSITGDGSTVTRSNGSGTSTFYLPDSTVNSKTVYIDLGISNHYTPLDLYLDLDTLVLNALSDSRAFSLTFSITKGIL